MQIYRNVRVLYVKILQLHTTERMLDADIALCFVCACVRAKAVSLKCLLVFDV